MENLEYKAQFDKFISCIQQYYTQHTTKFSNYMDAVVFILCKITFLNWLDRLVVLADKLIEEINYPKEFQVKNQQHTHIAEQKKGEITKRI